MGGKETALAACGGSSGVGWLRRGGGTALAACAGPRHGEICGGEERVTALAACGGSNGLRDWRLAALLGTLLSDPKDLPVDHPCRPRERGRGAGERREVDR